MIQKLFTQFNSPESILRAMRETLVKVCPQHQQEQYAFEHGLHILREALDDDQNKLLDFYIEEEERSIAEHFFYLFWKGVQQNYDCYRNPANSYFLKMDFEDFHQESLMTSFLPLNYKDIGTTFTRSLPKDIIVLSEPIVSYYCYLQSWGYKLAHYYGFCYADTFLQKVIPGYKPTQHLSIIYRSELEDYLGITSLSAN